MLLQLSVSAVAVGILAALSVSTVTGDNAATVPHPSCNVSASGTLLTCGAGNYSIPGNFDASLVPQGISNMRLGSLANTIAPTFRPDRLSTIHDDAPPLNVTSLTQLTLYSFQGTNGTRLPIEAFLISVKGTLSRLQLRGCAISPLGPTFLQGFSSLKLLRLGANDISAIDINAFETRISLSDATLPVVTTIDLQQNEISTLDWAVFAPVAPSLEYLGLHEQEGTTGLTTLTISKDFTFHVLEELELQDNAMGFPSRAILDTLKITNESSITFDMNAFCPDEYYGQNTSVCSCCAAKDFVTWAHKINDRPNGQKPVKLSFTCGGDGLGSHFSILGSSLGSIFNLPPKDQYNDCFNGSRSTMMTKTTPRTTKVIDARSSTSATPTTRPNQLGESSSVPSGPSGSGWANRSVTGLYGCALVVVLFLQYGV